MRVLPCDAAAGCEHLQKVPRLSSETLATARLSLAVALNSSPTHRDSTQGLSSPKLPGALQAGVSELCTGWSAAPFGLKEACEGAPMKRAPNQARPAKDAHFAVSHASQHDAASDRQARRAKFCQLPVGISPAKQIPAYLPAGEHIRLCLHPSVQAISATR